MRGCTVCVVSSLPSRRECSERVSARRVLPVLWLVHRSDKRHIFTMSCNVRDRRDHFRTRPSEPSGARTRARSPHTRSLSESRRLAHDLIKAYELPKRMRMRACGTDWQPASPLDVAKFHTDAYVHFLQQLTCNAYTVADEVTSYILNQSVCFAENSWCVPAARHAPMRASPGAPAHPRARHTSGATSTRSHNPQPFSLFLSLRPPSLPLSLTRRVL